MTNGSRAADGAAVMARAVELVEAGESFTMATVVWRQAPSSGQHGSRAIVTAQGELFGWIGGACAEPVLLREARRVLEEGNASLVWLGQPEDLEKMHVPEGVMTIPISCQSDGALQIFIEPVMAAPHVVIVGRSPMAVTLLDLVRDLGWRGDLIDAAEFGPAQVSASSAVIVATQGHGDEDVLALALESEAAFIGLVASAKRGRVVRDFLAERGGDLDKLARVQVPIGIDLGHTGHREIAVSILADLVRRRASGELKPSSVAGLDIVEPTTAIDLVCGMTVDAVAKNRPFEYGNVTYYFCAPGCRKAFEKDPDSFITTQQEAPC
ncbi:MAG: XdhC family protein [Actinomycetota bacterium]|nr:XdhC family protein [Actinomycetota bacterium]MEC9180729.1 XdhC family protein [Actinomycetota bacterium]MEC9212639.1 XdhC family protein [Actinomycetota bacterium]